MDEVYKHINKFRVMYVFEDNLLGPTCAAPDKEKRKEGIRKTSMDLAGLREIDNPENK